MLEPAAITKMGSATASLGIGEVVFDYGMEKLISKKRRLDAGSIKSSYEKRLLRFVSETLPHTLQSVWMIRPKSEDSPEIDQENDQNQANYHDERGCPAAAPWMSEKRVKIVVDESQRRPTALQDEDTFMAFLNQLVVNKEQILTTQAAVAIELRTQNDQLKSVALVYMIFDSQEPAFKVDLVNVYTFREAFSQDFQVHAPSKKSMNNFLRNLEYYEVLDEQKFSIRSIYRPCINEYCHASVEFKWTEPLDEVNLLSKPQLTSSNAKVEIELFPQKGEPHSELFELGEQITVLEEYNRLITEDEYQPRVKSLQGGDPTQLVSTIMEESASIDFTKAVWKTCYKLPLEKLLATMQLIIQTIPVHANRLRIDEGNMSTLGMRLTALKKGKRPPVSRRLGQMEAVEMLNECGEIYIDHVLSNISPDAYDIKQVVNKYNVGDDFETQINQFKDRYHLVLIGEAIRSLDLSVPKIVTVYEEFILSRKKSGSDSVKVEISLDPATAWHIATKVKPSSWELTYKTYKFLLTDVLIGDDKRVGKSSFNTYANGEGNLDYYVVEKTSTSL